MWYINMRFQIVFVIVFIKRSITAIDNDFDTLFFVSLVFLPLEEAPDQLSGSEDCTTPEETEKQQQESNTEIRITVKEEEEEDLVNSKQNAVIKHYWTLQHWKNWRTFQRFINQ